MNNRFKKVDTIVEVNSKKKRLPKWVFGSVAAAAILTAGFNASQTMAQNEAELEKLSIDKGSIVQTDTEKLLSVGHYVAETAASSSLTIDYDTIDKEKDMVITLPSLFKNDQYIARISDYIIEQMRQEMKATNQEKTYWVSGAGLQDEELVDLFTTIKADQNFYITKEGKLVIVFDEYEVAPGYMGVVEFEIPTKILDDILVSNEYIHD